VAFASAATVFAHGGGGGHGGGGMRGGFGGGGMPRGGFGGGGMPRGDFGGGMPRGDFGGGMPRGDFGGGMPRGDFGGGMPRDMGGRPIDGAAGRGLGDGGRIDGGPRLDGAGRIDGAAAGGFGAGRFAGPGNLSRADFQRIAARGLPGEGVGRGAVRPYSGAMLADRGAAIRGNFYRGGWYGGRGWYGDHFGAWWPGRWWGGFGWGMMAGLAWGDLASWGGYGAAPMAYDYGTTVAYQDDGVYVQGARVGTAEEYAQQASDLAAQGGTASVKEDDQWRPLGVFALARAEETNPSTFMSLAIDKDGLLRGTYYDAVSDSTTNMVGKVDKKTQKAAWTIGDKKTPVYEAGLANLTKQQTTILVHRDGGKVEQLLLVRVDDKAAGGAGGGKGSDAAATDAGASQSDQPDDAATAEPAA
jgi:hypothetical protein